MEVDSADELPVSGHDFASSTTSMDVNTPESISGTITSFSSSTINATISNNVEIPSAGQDQQLQRTSGTTRTQFVAVSAFPSENIEVISPMTKQYDSIVAEVVKRPLTKSCDDCVDLLLSQNFDRASSPCILTIVAYVQNILSDPTNSKFRSINLANKTFQEKISKVSASLELLQSIGFSGVPGSNTLQISASSSSLEATLKSLVVAMDKLQIPLEDRPKQKPPKSSFSEAQQNTFRESWDPYKSSIVSTAPQVNMQKKNQLNKLFNYVLFTR